MSQIWIGPLIALVLIILWAVYSELRNSRGGLAESDITRLIRSKVVKLRSRGITACKPANPADPAEVDGMNRLFLQFRNEGGDLDEFDAGELAILLPDAHISHAASTLPPKKVLELAKLFSQTDALEKCVKLLTDKVILAAVSIENGPEDILGMFIRAGALEEFAANKFPPGHPPDFYSSYAKTLMRYERLKEALTILSSKNASGLSSSDITDMFTLHCRLGHPEEALALLSRVEAAKPVRNDPDFYYRHARFAERSKEEWLAITIYKLFLNGRFDYQDVAKRYARMKAVLEAREGACVEDKPAAISLPVEPPPASRTLRIAPLTEVPAPTELLDGQYELGEVIGGGGIGIVYKAYDKKMDRIVAVKKMHAAISANKKARERFLQSAKIVAHLTHPYIVSIHNIVVEGDEIYLVFDYIDGKSLADALVGWNHFSPKDCKKIFSHVCEAVAAAHQARILHRDLKPANIMLDKNGYAKVLDFDLAREAKDSISKTTRPEAIGTPAYMAPEQHLGKAHRASDIFALGVTLYEMLTGQLPYDGPDYLVQKERRMYPPPNFLVPGLPKGIEKLMASVLEPDHKKRISDALDFLEEVRTL